MLPGLQHWPAWLSLCLLAPSALAAAASCPPAEELHYEVLGSLAHDPDSFTQGLVFAGKTLAESSGLYGQSRLILHRADGPQVLDLPDNRFAEGLAFFDQKLWQLSWKAGELRVYTTAPLQLQRRLRYKGEGWGLTHDGAQFILSDGSAQLSLRHSESFQEQGRLTVMAGAYPLRHLNELEWVEGQLYANVWQRELIARIDLQTGCVSGWLRLHELWPKMIRPDSADVLNGIAWQAQTRELWVTGKRWPRLYRLRLASLAGESP